MTKIRNISPKDAYAMLKKGALLVDVRTPREIAKKAFDTPDVMEIPLGSFEQRMQEIPAKRKVILACRRGNRSLFAARHLMSNGHRRVFNLEHGIIHWERDGLPVKSAPTQNPLSRLLQMFGKKA